MAVPVGGTGAGAGPRTGGAGAGAGGGTGTETELCHGDPAAKICQRLRTSRWQKSALSYLEDHIVFSS